MNLPCTLSENSLMILSALSKSSDQGDHALPPSSPIERSLYLLLSPSSFGLLTHSSLVALSSNMKVPFYIPVQKYAAFSYSRLTNMHQQESIHTKFTEAYN